MVHDYRVADVPEELYNCTALMQLAEVATTVRLQTSAIDCYDLSRHCLHRDWSARGDDCDKTYQSARESPVSSYHTEHTFEHAPTSQPSGADDKALNLSDKVSPQAVSCAKKKWKNEWVKSSCYQQLGSRQQERSCEETSHCYPLYPSVLYSTLSTPSSVTDTQQSFPSGTDDDSTSISCRNSIVSTSSPPATTHSSSDDDSLFNYSHKIFDRKKSRRDLSRNVNASESVSNHFPVPITDGDGSLSDGCGRKSSTSTSDYISDASSSSPLCHGDDVHVCPDCGKRYSTSSNLARHRQTHR